VLAVLLMAEDYPWTSADEHGHARAAGWSSGVALIAMFFFMSIMFPTIFALVVKPLGVEAKRGSSFLIMSIIGGRRTVLHGPGRGTSWRRLGL
jgi:MFS transporter, FHS family, L-fucose permease